MGPHLSVIKSLKAKCPGWPLGFAKAGRCAAFWQLHLAPDQRRLAIVTARDPQSGNQGAFPSNTPLFGGAAAIPQYVCIRSNFVTLANRIRKVPAVGHFDGSRIIVSRPLSERALLASTQLEGIFGFDHK